MSAKAAYVFRDALVEVASDRVTYTDDAITSEFTYESTVVEQLPEGKLRATPTAQGRARRCGAPQVRSACMRAPRAALEGGRGPSTRPSVDRSGAHPT